MSTYDAVVVGSGPNGLAAAITMAQVGRHTLVVEAKPSIGGGMRSAELTLPGFMHDVCSAGHPFGIASPFFKQLPLAKFGLEWLHSEASIAHPLDDRTVLAYTSLEQTAVALAGDEAAYRLLMQPLVRHWDHLAEEILQPLVHRPRHLLALAHFGWRALPPATILARLLFGTTEARALFAGIAAHAILPLQDLGTSAPGLVLGTLGHVAGWPIVKGGSQVLADALADYFVSLGGEIKTDWPVQTLKELPKARHTLLDISPKNFLAMSDDLPIGYRKRLESFRYGAGVFKLDYALSAPVPWRDADCAKAVTLHLGGTLEEIAASEQGLRRGQAPEKPYVLLMQPSLIDASRAPAGQHTLWAYCHVPHGFEGDMTAAIEQQISRFAPDFQDVVLARHITTTADLERYNANYIGGDINGGAADLWQLLARPLLSPTPYRTPLKGVYLCSASTPPGGGVHGMCGYNAARLALADG